MVVWEPLPPGALACTLRAVRAGFMETPSVPSAAEQRLAFGRVRVSELFFRDYRCITSVRHITYVWGESASSFDVAVVSSGAHDCLVFLLK